MLGWKEPRNGLILVKNERTDESFCTSSSLLPAMLLLLLVFRAIDRTDSALLTTTCDEREIEFCLRLKEGGRVKLLVKRPKIPTGGTRLGIDSVGDICDG